MRRAILPVCVAGILALALTGGARAGSEEAPEIADPEGDSRDPLGNGDILAAWIEDLDDTGFTTVLKLAEVDTEADRLADHYFVFAANGTLYCTFVYVDPHGGLIVNACVFDEARGFQAEGVDTEGNLTAGAPGYVRARFPLDYLRYPTDAIGDLRAYTYDFKRVHDPAFPVTGGHPQRADEALANVTVSIAIPEDEAPVLDGEPPAATVPENATVAPAVTVPEDSGRPVPMGSLGAAAAVAVAAVVGRRPRT